MFGGKLLVKTRKTVEGSYRQYAYQDTWDDSIDIAYDGELTDEVCKAIEVAFYNSKNCQKRQSLYGALRAAQDDSVKGVDREKRQLIISCGCSLCD